MALPNRNPGRMPADDDLGYFRDLPWDTRESVELRRQDVAQLFYALSRSVERSVTSPTSRTLARRFYNVRHHVLHGMVELQHFAHLIRCIRDRKRFDLDVWDAAIICLQALDAIPLPQHNSSWPRKESREVDSRTFPFSSLPYELRLTIWELAFPQLSGAPRVLEFYVVLGYSGLWLPRASNRVLLGIYPSIALVEMTMQSRLLLAINQETRALATRIWPHTLCPGTTDNAASVRFNRYLDVVMLRVADHEQVTAYNTDLPIPLFQYQVFNLSINPYEFRPCSRDSVTSEPWLKSFTHLKRLILYDSDAMWESSGRSLIDRSWSHLSHRTKCLVIIADVPLDYGEFFCTLAHWPSYLTLGPVAALRELKGSTLKLIEPRERHRFFDVGDQWGDYGRGSWPMVEVDLSENIVVDESSLPRLIRRCVLRLPESNRYLFES
ncbi:hypothetical protein DCS_00383 [Drechmeria coniospora]|uniref:2EXR domain-containing protein n=1 Tax=Drechmeria coniospora TaxID=98403 RepID=A0A151GQ82_DRECN|nr:hypothetical protein DCS_00383 [Drechmeria coniospora]KYK59253.1 hypothetical protein DCS_00383 [Drechmeria coniospora]